MANSNSIPSKVNFKVKQGDTFKRVFAFTLSDVAVDMSAATAKFIFDSDTITDLTIGSGLTWGTGADTNKLYLSTLVDFTGNIPYELEITYASGEVRTPIKGTVQVEAEITE